MLTRLTHAAIAFAVTAVMYQAYYLAVVPFVEPPATRARAVATNIQDAFEGAAAALDKHRELLTAYFPAGHWCFARPPVTIGNGQVMIVVDQGYQQSNDGKLRAPRMAVIFFQRAFTPGVAPPRDAIILEPSGGAELQLEQVIGKGVVGFGPIQHGELKGDVIVRSDMNEPGAADDLLIKTRDLYINEDLIRTDAPVDMKLGRHHGYGRELEVRLMKTDATGIAGLYGRFEDLVIKHDVMASFAPSESTSLAKTKNADGKTGPAPPIRIKSAGPFRIDLGSYKATFEDQVRSWQLHPDGTMDELTAAKLTMFFAKTNEWNSGEAASAGGPAGASASALTLEPASLEALGSPEAPVILKAPSQQASAKGRRLWIEMAGRNLSRITLEDGDEAVLRHQGSEIHARTLVYQLPPENSGQRLGTLWVRGGGGWMQAVIDPQRPHETLEVTWGTAMHLLRRQGQPVLILDGRPKVRMPGRTLWADYLEIFLREQPAAPKGDSSLSSAVSPQLITARGSVDIESSELAGKVNALNIRFHQDSAGAAPNQAPATVAGAGSPYGGTTSNSPFNLADSGGGPRRAYYVEGISLNVDIVMRGRRPDVRGINVDGNVLFKETPLSGGPPPLQIVAEQLTVTGADTPNATIDIIGSGGQNGAPVKMAEIYAGGAEIKAPRLTINRGASEARINSPGKLVMLVDRDLTGSPLPQPQPLDITWQQEMRLEGRRITFVGDVHVANTSGWLRTQELVAQMTRDIRFDGGGGQEQPRLEQLECHKGAVAEFEQRDISGVVGRHHLELQWLKANQINGNLEGAGPGFIDSVHFAKNTANLLALPGGAGGQAAAPQLVQADPELRRLHIDFVRQVDGNLTKKIIWVRGDVEAVYGPVKSWDERLVMSPGGDPEPGVVWITSDSLGVFQSVLANVVGPKTPQFELQAEGKVSIESQDRQRGMLTAYGHRASYDQSKGLFILEGDGVRPATLEHQPTPGAITSPQTAQRFSFNQNTGSVRVDGVGQVKINQTPSAQESRQPGAAPFR
jgi:hypothetical protein